MGIFCNNITKFYGDNIILQNVSFALPDMGLFLLMGESGSGKTTLLNILYGLTSFVQGSVCINEQSFSGKVDRKTAERIGYLLQDSYFVEYLTMMDNLRLSGGTDSEIKKLAEHFHIEKHLTEYPRKLSGGQKQRAALLRLLLMEKEILLLDEPTSSVDRKEKAVIFKILKELSKDHLILCATHDESMLEIADGYITPDNEWSLETVAKKEDSGNIHKNDLPGSSVQNETDDGIGRPAGHTNGFSLLHYLTGYYRYPEREKKSGLLMILVFAFALAAVYYVSDFRGKLERTISSRYDFNGLEVCINVDREQECRDILKEAGAKEILFNYGRNLPAEDMVFDEQDGDNAMAPEFSYISNLNVFPAKKENFPYQDAIIEGGYFTGDNQVILSKEYVKAHYPNRKGLVGSMIDLELPDGKDTFEVAGILDTMREETEAYFSNIFKVDTGICINGAYLEKYCQDDVVGEMEATQHMLGCIVYFSDYQQVQNFQKKYKNDENFIITGYEDANPVLRIKTASRRMYTMPVVFVAVLVCIMFYFQIRQIEMAQNKENLCVYLYCGYSRGRLLAGMITFYLRDVVLRYLAAVFLATGTVEVFEWFNVRFHFTEFALFAFDGKNTLRIGLLLCFAGMLLSMWMFFTMHLKGWYHTLNQRRDIL